MEEPLIGRIKHLNVTFRPALGSGAFGTVYKCENTVTKNVCAAKEIKLGDRVGQNPRLVQMAEQELDVVMKLQSHNNIVKVLEYFTHGNSFWIVMEFCDEGDLKMYLSKHEKMSRYAQAQILSQSASAVAFMHAQSPPIVHRDIKLQNILMKAEGGQVVLKICDFGFAKFYENPGSTSYSAIFKQGPMMDSLKGTAPFMAPEFSAQLEGGLQYDSSVDVFALGLVFRVVLEPSNPDFYPLSVEAQKVNRYVNIGYEMIHCHREKKPMPTVIAIHEEDDRIMKRMKRIVTNMTKFKPSKRKDIDEVDEELTEILAMLEEARSNTTPGEGACAAASIPVSIASLKVSKQPEPSASLSFLLGKTWTRQHQVNLPDTPEALRGINGQILQCVGNDGIIIYNNNLLEQRRIKLNCQLIFDVAELPNGDMVVGTADDLLHITTTGKIVQKLSSGWFHSVVVHDNIIFAFNDTKPEIQRHALSDNLWKRLESIHHENLPRGGIATLCVDGNAIYACYYDAAKIDSFSRDGKFKATYSEKGSGRLGQWKAVNKNLRICAQDSQGAILVADRKNNRLQILDTKSGQWRVVDVQPGPMSPWHALLHNGRLYIASYDKQTLSVYKAT